MILAIYGAGGLGREVLEIVKLQPRYEERWSSILFVDDINPHRCLRDLPVLSFEEVISNYSFSEVEFLIAVGEPFLRQKLYEKIKNKHYSLTKLIHPTVTIPDSTIVNEGVVIGAFSLISCDITIKENTYIQNHVSIGHDSQIGAHCVLSAFDAISGACQIGSCTYLAMSIPVKENLTIGSGSIIGMGSVVCRDIPDDVIAMGNPARPMKNNTDHKVFGS